MGHGRAFGINKSEQTPAVSCARGGHGAATAAVPPPVAPGDAGAGGDTELGLFAAPAGALSRCHLLSRPKKTRLPRGKIK